MSFKLANNSTEAQIQISKLKFFWILKKFILDKMDKGELDFDKADKILENARELMDDDKVEDFDILFEKFSELKNYTYLIKNRQAENDDSALVNSLDNALKSGDLQTAEKLLL